MIFCRIPPNRLFREIWYQNWFLYLHHSRQNSGFSHSFPFQNFRLLYTSQLYFKSNGTIFQNFWVDTHTTASPNRNWPKNKTKQNKKQAPICTFFKVGFKWNPLVHKREWSEKELRHLSAKLCLICLCLANNGVLSPEFCLEWWR